MASQKALKSLGVLTKVDQFSNPRLLVDLPGAIVTRIVRGPAYGPYRDPRRQELDSQAANASFFDALTIQPVNKYLDERGIPLSEGAQRAIMEDMEHTRNLSERKTSTDLKAQAAHQRRIAEEFAKSGEMEGYFLHNRLADLFAARAAVLQVIEKAKKVELPQLPRLVPRNMKMH